MFIGRLAQHPGSTALSVTNLSGCLNLGLGISAILNLVNPNIRQILKLTISLVLCGLLSGCVPIAMLFTDVAASAAVGAIAQPDSEPWNTGKNHYEPIILTSNEDMIRIKYLSVGPNAEHGQVTQLISDHCDGAYIETSREELRGYDTVEAECTHDPVSLQ